jgi:hypothetical protein
MFYWEDTSDEVIRRDVSFIEALELKSPPPLGKVHVFTVAHSPERGFREADAAVCGHEFPPGRRLQGARSHPFGEDRECHTCREIVIMRWGEDAWTTS